LLRGCIRHWDCDRSRELDQLTVQFDLWRVRGRSRTDRRQSTIAPRPIGRNAHRWPARYGCPVGGLDHIEIVLRMYRVHLAEACSVRVGTPPGGPFVGGVRKRNQRRVCE
jgi:hypothetical protein